MKKAKLPTKPVSKISMVADLFRRKGSASLAELIAATGWITHTTRAALTGLRKKGQRIERGTRDGVTTYTIPAS